jgi:hypothetical protein
MNITQNANGSYSNLNNFGKDILFRDCNNKVLSYDALGTKYFVFELRVRVNSVTKIFIGASCCSVADRLGWLFSIKKYLTDVHIAKEVLIIIREHYNHLDRAEMEYVKDQHLFNVCKRELNKTGKVKWKSCDEYLNPLIFHRYDLEHILNKQFNNWNYLSLMKRNK